MKGEIGLERRKVGGNVELVRFDGGTHGHIVRSKGALVLEITKANWISKAQESCIIKSVEDAN